jgi:SAM-dependent methyltransferase
MQASYLRYKRETLGRLRGDVLEIGAGRGATLDFYGPHVRWIGLEPDARRRAQLARAAAAHGHTAPVLDSPAERLPLPDGCVDAVVATVVLCSVTDPAAVLGEIRRVLRPGGAFTFFEHVVAPPGSLRRRAQHAVGPLTRRFDHGCDPTRDTGAAIAAAGFDRVEMAGYRRSALSVIRHHYIAGQATA